MLNAMRNNRKFLTIVLWIVILAFLSTIFVVWGLGPKENQGSFAIKVGDETVSYDEYKSYYDNAIQRYRNRYGEAYDDFAKTNDVDKTIIDELVNRKLFIKEAKRLGVIATDTEIVAALRSIPSFQKDGVLDRELYQEVLRYNRQTPAKFEEGIRSDILLQKVVNIISGSAFNVTDEEILQEYNARNVRKSVSFISVPVTKFTPAKVEEQDIATYFENNKNSYKTQSEIKLKYIVLDQAGFKYDDIAIADADIEKYYAENIAKYTTKESLDVSQVFTRVTDWKDSKAVADAKAKIDEALLQIKEKKADFSDVAKKYSDDTSAVRGGVLGSIIKGSTVPEFEEAAFKLKVGEITDIVKSDLGFHIIKLTAKQPEKVELLQNKKAEITAILREGGKVSAYRNYVLTLYREIVKSGNITAYLAKTSDAKLNVIETAFFKENDKILPIFYSVPSLEKALFNIGKSDVSQLIEDKEQTYLFEIADKIPSTVPDIKTIYDRVKSDYIKATESSKAISEITALLEDNKSISDIAAAYNITVEAANMGRDTANLLSKDSALRDKIFRSKDNSTIKSVYMIDNEAVVASVGVSTLPDKAGLESQKKSLKDYISAVKSDETLKSYIDSLKLKNKVIINEALLPTK